jgi:Short C-terminal domain
MKISKKSILGGPVAMTISATKNRAAERATDQSDQTELEVEPVSDGSDGSEDVGQGEFGDGVTKPLYEFTASRWRGGRMFTPNVIKVWSDRIEEYEHHVLLKKGTQAINYHQLAQVRLARGLRWSDVSVESTGGHMITLRGVPKSDGEKVKALIDNAVNEARRGAFAPAAVTAPVDDPAEQLKKLADLHLSGLLTDEEFATKRAVLVAKL